MVGVVKIAGRLTEVGLADCPLDHGKFQGSSYSDEQWQEAVHSEGLFAWPTLDAALQKARGILHGPSSGGVDE